MSAVPIRIQNKSLKYFELNNSIKKYIQKEKLNRAINARSPASYSMAILTVFKVFKLF